MQLVAATVLYGERCHAIEAGTNFDTAGESLWIQARDLQEVSGFALTPQGACRGDLCIPVPAGMVRDDFFDIVAFANHLGQAVAAEPEARVWSFGSITAPGSGLSSSRIAPDVTVSDRLGRPVHLAGFRGKKVLVVTWASW